jgi:hypothetical protein
MWFEEIWCSKSCSSVADTRRVRGECSDTTACVEVLVIVSDLEARQDGRRLNSLMRTNERRRRDQAASVRILYESWVGLRLGVR